MVFKKQQLANPTHSAFIFYSSLAKTWEQMVCTPIDQNNLLCGSSELKSVPMPLNLVQEVIKACQTNLTRKSINITSWGQGLKCKWIVLGLRKPQTCWRRVDVNERYREKKILKHSLLVINACQWNTMCANLCLDYSYSYIRNAGPSDNILTWAGHIPSCIYVTLMSLCVRSWVHPCVLGSTHACVSVPLCLCASFIQEFPW